MKLILCLLITLHFSGVLAEENPLPINWQGLPKPYATKSAVNPPNIIPRPKNAKLSLPDGFQVEEYLTGFQSPRYMINGGDGEFFLSDMDTGIVHVIKDKKVKKLIKKLRQPFGLALHNGWLYVADARAVQRYPYNETVMEVGEPEKIINLKPYASGHITRSIIIDKENQKLYLSVGSKSNVDSGEPEIRAAITRYNLDGTGYELFASGIRNAVGMRWHPESKELWVTSHERDGLGDDLVPDFLTKVKPGGFYGWPYAYIGPHEDPRRKNEAPNKVKESLYPSVLLGGHVGAMDVLFYTGSMYPENYRNGAFVALHGSWNRSKRAGYKIVFVPFDGAEPTSGPVDFLTGWMVSPDSRKVWGRPVGLLQRQDGSLLISDDSAGTIWRVSYQSKD